VIYWTFFLEKPTDTLVLMIEENFDPVTVFAGDSGNSWYVLNSGLPAIREIKNERKVRK
jgi:hypothetical protein